MTRAVSLDPSSTSSGSTQQRVPISRVASSSAYVVGADLCLY